MLNARRWKFFLAIAFILGILLRTLYVSDMEYKEDEEYNFTQTQGIGLAHPFPWVGMPSGVYLQNPGMSIWVFIGLAKVSGAQEPTELCRALQIFSLLGIAMILPFALGFLREEEREPWFWAMAFALVNPFAILYERKLWPEPFLPFFTMLMLMGWWKRDRRLGAFVWGSVGALLGQIHMSGFFFALGFVVWTLAFDRYRKRAAPVHWKAWFLGSCLGSLPMIPWIYYIFQHPVHESMVAGWNEASQLKFWAFWITDSLGIHLGNPLGLLKGNNNFDQISDFIRYPILADHATYLVGVAHLGALVCAILILGRGAVLVYRLRGHWGKGMIGSGSETSFAQNAAFFGYGILVTASTVVIRRYYMMVTFPLEFVWLAQAALFAIPGRSNPKAPYRAILATLWACELVISAGFVGYVHVNNGSTAGDYGKAYHVIMDERKAGH